MGWMETLTKEAFVAAVREAVRPDFEALEKRLEGEIKGLQGQITGLQGQVQGFQRESDSNQKVLEGKIENIHISVKSFFNETKADFFQKLYEGRIEVSKSPLPSTSEQK